MSDGPFSGGCQCGAVRFRVGRLGGSGVCHCRMCQKAVGMFYGAYVTAFDVTWTRGHPKHFASSNKASRGFCGDCGTPLTFEIPGNEIEMAVGAFDDPTVAAPTAQVNPHDKLPFVDGICLPTRPPTDRLPLDARAPDFVNYQHPDHDTAVWPPEGRRHG